MTRIAAVTRGKQISHPRISLLSRMLFTTYTFVLWYLPIVAVGAFLVARRSHTAAVIWLFGASLVFYGYWAPRFTLLLGSSIVTNYLVGRQISAAVAGDPSRSKARIWLILGIAFDLGLLCYFKYLNFFVDTITSVTGLQIPIAKITLPIGISFFTFTQIAFLADTYQKGLKEYRFAHYGLFVTYFPHLVAGPVLHHSQMMPQFEEAGTFKVNSANLAAGLMIFCLGLVKKVVVADGISPYADAVFNAADHGTVPTFGVAWLGALAYTFQLYFDFSGYSDMAIGLSRILNVRLPFNFDSPYKSRNISEFWRRWHMSLSTFLRDYLYIPLGGNRRGAVRRYINLALTMLLGGLWHGASWTFVLWGGLHGAYLMVNHAFSALVSKKLPAVRTSVLFHGASWAVTMLAVVVGWVFFRAKTFGGAVSLLAGMAHPATLLPAGSIAPLLWNAGLDGTRGVAACGLLAVVTCLAPNSNRIGDVFLRECEKHWRLRYLTLGAMLILVLLLATINEARSTISAFIYFNF